MPCQSWSQLWSLALEKAHLLTLTCNSPFDFIFTDQPLSLMLIRTLLAELAAHSVPTFPNSALQDYWFFNTTLFTISRIYEVLARRNLLMSLEFVQSQGCSGRLTSSKEASGNFLLSAFPMPQAYLELPGFAVIGHLNCKGGCGRGGVRHVGPSWLSHRLYFFFSNLWLLK